MLESFVFEPYLLEFKDGGIYTTVQDLPGRTQGRNGIPLSGPMDSISFKSELRFPEVQDLRTY